ncbi:M20/M25/M40 family metallo-hydrolase [Candidatus Margulisiibacteriota bacterium]
MINQKRLIKTFLDLVKIDSESGNEAAIRKELTGRLRKLGLKTSVDKVGNLHAVRPGKAKGPALLFSAHMDTVKPGRGVIPVIKDGKIYSKGQTILGADDKSGIAEILEMLEVLKETKTTSVPIKVLFTVSEEIGLKGSAAITKQTIKHAEGATDNTFGFILDAHGPIGTVITSAPTHDTFVATVKGKSSHAGIEPDKGINAIVAAAKAIAKMTLGRIDEETTANIGVIEGGMATNIIPAEVIVKGEARSRNINKLTKQITHMKDTLDTECKKLGAKVAFKKTREYKAFNIPANNEVLNICALSAKKTKVKLRLESTCGGSDANHINALGIPAVVLSSGMAKVHSTDEFIKIADMVKATEFVLNVVLLIKPHNT